MPRTGLFGRRAHDVVVEFDIFLITIEKIADIAAEIEDPAA